ncbi:unnamed protein product [Brassica rapa]|uniref:Uncharacterized protein n=1 Tax=Brassica campestris TaxID=3711 RepID=A0A8D9HLI2_BRACM|nr:unnamed protein product [Brassica rapa]
MPPKDDNSEESVKLFLSTVSAAEMFSVRAALSWLRFCFVNGKKWRIFFCVYRQVKQKSPMVAQKNVFSSFFESAADYTVSQSSAPTLPLMLTMKPLVRFTQRMTLRK